MEFREIENNHSLNEYGEERQNKKSMVIKGHGDWVTSKSIQILDPRLPCINLFGTTHITQHTPLCLPHSTAHIIQSTAQISPILSVWIDITKLLLRLVWINVMEINRIFIL